MKKLLIILIIFSSCHSIKIGNSVKEEALILENNLKIVKAKYPKYKVEQFRYFSYLFTAIKNKDTLELRVNKKGLIEQIKF